MDEFLWSEKYRPHTIDDCILPERIKQLFEVSLARGEIQTMLLHGSAGTGKTTIARALCDELQCDYLLINGSLESGIDVLRSKIFQFASTMSFSGKTKVVILDEADHLTATLQAALRGFIEEFSENCRFIFTCNFKNRIIDPLQSRCANIDFALSKDERTAMSKEFYLRTVDILKAENVPFDKQALGRLVLRHFPDYRRILNELQRYSVAGKIDGGILNNAKEESIKALIQLLKDKEFTKMRKWVAENLDNDVNQLIRKLFDGMNDTVEPVSIPKLVLILADYQYKAAFVADVELNTVAMLTEVMADCQFK
jgi:DNA polymerase III delta prime subunit